MNVVIFFLFGVIAVEMLTGSRPFTGKTSQELFTAILNQIFTISDSVAKDQRLYRMLRKCLAQDPAGRFSSAAEMRCELIPAIEAYSHVEYSSSADPDAVPTLLKLSGSHLSVSGNRVETRLAR